MRSFWNTPIKQKLIAISLLSSAAALLLACGGFIAYELRAYREATLNQLTSVAGVIAANSSSALSFDDPESAEHTLTALRSERMVVAACIYGADERIFAAYYKDLKQERCAPRRSAEIEESRDGLDVSMPIVAEGEDALGVIVIRSRPIDLYERLARYGGILGLVMLFSGLASWPLASKLQRFISDPILQLVETSRRVSADKDFSLRAVSKGEDEVGVLVESFNQMLEQIEDRDQALSRHRENLEAEVERRTGELRAVNAKLTREISQREQAEDRIRDLAYYDGLTGLPNRQLFQERLRRALAWAKRRNQCVGLLFLDLDRFKQVNDTLGHSVGDELLRRVSDRMHNSVRLGDYVGRSEARPKGEVSRLGGDEFTVLLTKLAHPEDAAKVAQRVLEELAKPIPVGDYELYTSASIGIAVYPADGEDLETLLRNADTAMYHAKSHNGNNFQFYTEAMNATAARKLNLASRLRHALDENQFALHYQPIRDAETGAVCAAEALLRWTIPDTGPVRPDEFIPIAEDSGLILSIGEWVLRRACAQARHWQTEGFEPIRIAVNVSTHQLRQPSWPKVVARILEEEGLSPAHLELELTESAILAHEDSTVQALSELHDMGIGLALDDFGTGYSSLSSLRRFPIERVKIDRSFVGDITADPDDATLTTAILSMAHSLNLRVVAEGVETLEQAEFLSARGCHELQGFLFSPPVPPAEFVRFLQRTKV